MHRVHLDHLPYVDSSYQQILTYLDQALEVTTVLDRASAANDPGGNDQEKGQIMAAETDVGRRADASDRRLLGGQRPLLAHVLVYVFVIVPFAALGAAIPWAWGWGISWMDAIMAAAWYTITLLGITVGFHRYFTHGSFKAQRPVRIALAVAGSMAIQGPITHWVADHRRHHAYADRDGDPHSPWAFGTSSTALLRGIWHAHVGWILNRNLSNQQRFAPDLLADPDMQVIHRGFGALALVSILAPALIGGLLTWSWQALLRPSSGQASYAPVSRAT